jgi:hypothetical protein
MRKFLVCHGNLSRVLILLTIGGNFALAPDGDDLVYTYLSPTRK